MFEIRTRNSEAVLKRQIRPTIEISSNGENIPLEENWKERWCTLPQDFRDVFKSHYEFEVRDDDVFVVTFPKCGTTWTQEAAWLLLNDLDYEGAHKEDLHSRSIFMDLSGLYSEESENSLETAAALKAPRLLKSHLPAYLIPRQIWEKKTKIIYCARNPKDVAVSYCHFHRGLATWKGSIDEFIEDFINNDIMYTPYWPSVLDFWKMRNEPNILFISYEEMKHDLAEVLKRMAAFLGKPPPSEQELHKLVKHLSFDNMKENQSTNPTKQIKNELETQVLPDFQFMRRGIVGSYKDELSVENQKKLDQWTEDNLKGLNVTPQDIFGDF